jgi:hypothetical protein
MAVLKSYTTNQTYTQKLAYSSPTMSTTATSSPTHICSEEETKAWALEMADTAVFNDGTMYSDEMHWAQVDFQINVQHMRTYFEEQKNKVFSTLSPNSVDSVVCDMCSTECSIEGSKRGGIVFEEGTNDDFYMSKRCICSVCLEAPNVPVWVKNKIRR